MNRPRQVLTGNHFFHAASSILQRANTGDGRARAFKSLFGISANTCSVLVWNLCEFPRLSNVRPQHLLWALNFLKVYASEAALIAIVGGGPTRKTHRKWVWYVIERRIAAKRPSVVSWELGSVERSTSQANPLLTACCCHI